MATFSHAAHASDPESAHLWHQRLGHLNYQALYSLVRAGHLQGIRVPADAFKHKHNDKCDVCVMAKHPRAPARPREQRAAQPMDVLHSDVCIYPEPALDGTKVAVTLLDECSGYGGVATLKAKSEVAATLQAAILRWETRTQRSCRKLYTDRGGEYLGAGFAQWCAAKGIIHEKSVPYCPQDNGKAERLNKTLNNAVRAMLLQYNLSKQLWSHALLYAVRLYNVGLNTRLGTTRHYAFLQEVPNVSHLRTFGCRVFALQPVARRDKLDPKSEIGIYLGPCCDGPGHKVLMYTPGKRTQQYTVRICRDIVTYEQLVDVCDAQMPSVLRWGGPIPLPAAPRAPVPVQPEVEQESVLRPLTVDQLQWLLLPAPPVTTNSPGPPLPQLPAGTTGPGMDAVHQGTNSLPPGDGGGAEAHAGEHAPAESQGRTTPAGAAGRYPARNRKQTSWLRGGNQDAPQGYESVGFVSTHPPASALFDVAAEGLGTTEPVGVPSRVDPATGRQLKVTKISAASSPVPFQHLVVPLPPSGPVVPMSAAKQYYETHPLPRTVEHAMRSPFAKFWLEALHAEMDSLHANGTWALVPRVSHMKVIPCKWVFALKYDAAGHVTRFKTRLVAGGHRQEEGIDYNETYAPVSRLATLRTFLAVTAWHRWEVHQLDITTAFLNGAADTDVYMLQPPGFRDGTNLVCHLQKMSVRIEAGTACVVPNSQTGLARPGFPPHFCRHQFLGHPWPCCSVPHQCGG